MESKQLDNWEAKYWKSELSEVEEKQFIAELLARKPQLSGSLLQLAEWFEGQQESRKEIVLDDSFEDRIFEKIEERENSSPNWNWLKVAAAAILVPLMIYVSLSLPNSESKISQKSSVENPELAYKEAKATLKLMAGIMNDSKQHLNSLEMINVAQEKVKNTFQSKPQKKEDS